MPGDAARRHPFVKTRLTVLFNGIGWYCNTLQITKIGSTKLCFIVFDGVMANSADPARRIIAIVRATGDTGNITVTASTLELPDAMLTIPVLPAKTRVPLRSF